MKQLTIEDIQERLQKFYPNENITILNYSNQSSPCTIKCNTCGEKIKFKYAYNMFTKGKKRLCPVCFPNKRNQIANKIIKFKTYINNSEQFTLLDTDFSKVHSDTLISCTCNKCGSLNKKTMRDYLRGRGCLNCSGNKQKTTENFKNQLSEDYELLSPYLDANSKVLLRHSCGFIYKVTPHNYLTGKRCPRCSRTESKGELIIRKFLEEHNISFIKEYNIKLKGHNLRFDYYLPEKDKYIEYNGIQHYEPVQHFGGVERFKIQQEYDKLKQDYAKDKLIVVSYLNFDKIKEILSKDLL